MIAALAIAAFVLASAAIAGVAYLLFVEGELGRFDRRHDARALARASATHSDRLSDLERALMALEHLLARNLDLRRD